MGNDPRPGLRGHPPAETIVKRGGTSYIFVTEGIENALLRAREAAGSDDVQVNGGADIARQFFEVGKVDELEIHLVPVLLGGGRRPFDHLGPEHIELERTHIVEGKGGVTHMHYRVRP